MSHRIILFALALIGAGMIALGLVWPQGQGRPSPAPFGRPLSAVETRVKVPGQLPIDLRGLQDQPKAAPAAPAP